MEFVLWIAGSLAFVLVMRWAIRRVAFRFMRFNVPLRGKTYVYHRERFADSEGRRVTDPVLLAELKEAWRAIELQTANDVARIQSGDL